MRIRIITKIKFGEKYNKSEFIEKFVNKQIKLNTDKNILSTLKQSLLLSKLNKKDIFFNTS